MDLIDSTDASDMTVPVLPNKIKLMNAVATRECVGGKDGEGGDGDGDGAAGYRTLASASASAAVPKGWSDGALCWVGWDRTGRGAREWQKS